MVAELFDSLTEPQAIYFVTRLAIKQKLLLLYAERISESINESINW